MSDTHNAKKHEYGEGPTRYWTFPETSTAELLKRLQEAGEFSRLRVRPENGHLMLSVIPAADSPLAQADVLPEINDSLLCPPWC